MFLTWCYPLQQRVHARPRTSPVRMASAFQPGGAAMASQSALTVLTRLTQPAVSVVAGRMHNYRGMCVETNNVAAPVWAFCWSWGCQLQPFVLDCISSCQPVSKVPETRVSCRCSKLLTSVNPLFMEMGEKGGNKMALCCLLRSHLIRGELEMITSEYPSLCRGVWLHVLFRLLAQANWLNEAGSQ